MGLHRNIIQKQLLELTKHTQDRYIDKCIIEALQLHCSGVCWCPGVLVCVAPQPTRPRPGPPVTNDVTIITGIALVISHHLQHMPSCNRTTIIDNIYRNQNTFIF